MADEFDPQKLDRLLTQLGESVLVSAQNLEKFTDPDFFSHAAQVTATPFDLAGGRDFPVELGVPSDVVGGFAAERPEGVELLPGNTPLGQHSDLVLAQVPALEAPAVADESSDFNGGIRPPDLDSDVAGLFAAEADSAVSGVQIAAAGSTPTVGGFHDSNIQEEIDAITDWWNGGGIAGAGSPGLAGSSAGSVADLEDWARTASGENEYSAEIAPDPGAEDAAARGETHGALGSVDLSLGLEPDLRGDEFSGIEFGAHAREHLSPGYQQTFDTESTDEILESAREFADESREWRRTMLAVLRGIVNDLRTDNSLLNEIRRHFEQSRRSY